MKRFVFEITVVEGNDEFWEDLTARNVSGCDEILESLEESLRDSGFASGFDTVIRLKEFTDKE